jgi:hypothetical protein
MRHRWCDEHHIVSGDHGISILPDAGGLELDRRVFDLPVDPFQDIRLGLYRTVGVEIRKVIRQQLPDGGRVGLHHRIVKLFLRGEHRFFIARSCQTGEGGHRKRNQEGKKLHRHDHSKANFKARRAEVPNGIRPADFMRCFEAQPCDSSIRTNALPESAFTGLVQSPDRQLVSLELPLERGGSLRWLPADWNEVPPSSPPGWRSRESMALQPGNHHLRLCGR